MSNNSGQRLMLWLKWSWFVGQSKGKLRVCILAQFRDDAANAPVFRCHTAESDGITKRHLNRYWEIEREAYMGIHRRAAQDLVHSLQR